MGWAGGPDMEPDQPDKNTVNPRVCWPAPLPLAEAPTTEDATAEPGFPSAPASMSAHPRLSSFAPLLPMLDEGWYPGMLVWDCMSADDVSRALAPGFLFFRTAAMGTGRTYYLKGFTYDMSLAIFNSHQLPRTGHRFFVSKVLFETCRVL